MYNRVRWMSRYQSLIVALWGFTCCIRNGSTRFVLFFFLLHKSYYCYTRLSFLPAASRNLVFFFLFLPEDHVKIDLSMVMYINRETSISLKRHVICMVLLIKGKSRGKSLIFQQERYNLNGTLSLLLLNNPSHVLCTELRHQPSER